MYIHTDIHTHINMKTEISQERVAVNIIVQFDEYCTILCTEANKWNLAIASQRLIPPVSQSSRIHVGNRFDCWYGLSYCCRRYPYSYCWNSFAPPMSRDCCRTTIGCCLTSCLCRGSNGQLSRTEWWNVVTFNERLLARCKCSNSRNSQHIGIQ
jgi:hypothetical protein